MTTPPAERTPADLDNFRQRLGEEADRLRSLLATMESGAVPDGEEVATPEDAAAEAGLQEQYSAQTRDLAQALRAAESALGRLDAGTFGICVDCGQPIPTARLEARPTAERCIQCEEKWERARRR